MLSVLPLPILYWFGRFNVLMYSMCLLNSSYVACCNSSKHMFYARYKYFMFNLYMANIKPTLSGRGRGVWLLVKGNILAWMSSWYCVLCFFLWLGKGWLTSLHWKKYEHLRFDLYRYLTLTAPHVCFVVVFHDSSTGIQVEACRSRGRLSFLLFPYRIYSLWKATC